MIPEIVPKLYGIHPDEIGPQHGPFCVILNTGKLGYGDTAWHAFEDAGFTGETEDVDVWLWASPKWPFVQPVFRKDDGEQIGYLFKF